GRAAPAAAAGAGNAGAAAPAGSAALAPTDGGAEAEKHPAPAPADEADGTDPADGTGTGGDAEPAAQEAAAQHTSTEAKALVDDLQLDRKRATSPFPGHLDISRSSAPSPAREAGDAEGAGAAPLAPGGSPRVAQPLPALLLPVLPALPARPKEPIPARSPLRTRTSPRAPRARTGRSPVTPPPRLRWRPLPKSRPD